MKKYIIIAKDEPENLPQAAADERKALLDAHPKAAEYGPYILMPVMQNAVEQMVVDNPDNKVDLSGSLIGDGETDDMTQAEFLALHDQLAAQPNTGRVVILSVQQGRLLHSERYAPSEAA